MNLIVKKIMRKTFITVGVVLAFVALLAIIIILFKPKSVKLPVSVSSISELEEWMNKSVNAHTPYGLSFAVVKNNKMIYSKGFGLADGPRNIKAAPDNIWKWWSVTKVITAATIFQLQEKGKLNIDDEVSKYLPYFKVKYPVQSKMKPVTIRQLLNHSSGMPNNIPEIFAWMHTENETKMSETEFFKKIFPRYSRLRFEPGSHGAYSNIEYIALGAIIEAVSGKRYEEYVMENIIEPLGMKQTNFVMTEEMRAKAATGAYPLIDPISLVIPFLYFDKMGEMCREVKFQRMWFNNFYPNSSPPTGLIGSTYDMARFAMAYLNGGELDGNRILEEKTIKALYNDGYLAPGKGNILKFGNRKFEYGMGWFKIYDGKRVFLQHDGEGPGFFASMRLYPDEKIAIVLQTNDMWSNKKLMDLISSVQW